MTIISPNGKDLIGAIHVLQTIHKTQSNNYIKLEASPKQNDTNNWSPIDIVIDYSKIEPATTNNWCSYDSPNSYFTLFFPKNSLKITDYTLVSRNNGQGSLLRTWKLEGSNDNSNWRYIDHINNDPDLVTPGTTKTFKVQKQGRYKYFKFTQNGTSAAENNHMCLCKVDVFGTLYGQRYTCINKHTGISIKLLSFINLLP